MIKLQTVRDDFRQHKLIGHFRAAKNIGKLFFLFGFVLNETHELVLTTTSPEQSGQTGSLTDVSVELCFS